MLLKERAGLFFLRKVLVPPATCVGDENAYGIKSPSFFPFHNASVQLLYPPSVALDCRGYFH